MIFGRGDGVGLELDHRLVRGVRLQDDHPGLVAAVSEFEIGDLDDDHDVLGAFVRLRADLGGQGEPTRLATFPSGSTLHRLDATGLTGTELTALRWSLHRDAGATSTVLLDDGPRRWLVAVRWDDAAARRVEELARRAGFRDVTVEPSPIALARVLDADVTRVRRRASAGDSFEMLCRSGIPVAAATVDASGPEPPGLLVDTEAFPADWFADTIDPAELTAELGRFLADLGEGAPDRGRSEVETPPVPPSSAFERQCVALGAAIGAAGLAGRLRPGDLVVPAITAHPASASELPPLPEPERIGALRRALARMRRRRR